MKKSLIRVAVALLLTLIVLGVVTKVRTERAVQAHTDTRTSQHQSILDAIDNKE